MEQQEASLESFLKWAAEHGVSDSPPSSSSSLSSSSYSCLGHSLSISHFPQAGGRGLAAVRDLRKGEMILRVPKSMLMTRDSVMDKDQTIAHALKLYPSLSSTQVLAVCLLAELNKGRRSVWYPYLMELPRSYHTLTTFGPFETKALQVWLLHLLKDLCCYCYVSVTSIHRLLLVLIFHLFSPPLDPVIIS